MSYLPGASLRLFKGGLTPRDLLLTSTSPQGRMATDTATGALLAAGIGGFAAAFAVAPGLVSGLAAFATVAVALAFPVAAPVLVSVPVAMGPAAPDGTEVADASGAVDATAVEALSAPDGGAVDVPGVRPGLSRAAAVSAPFDGDAPELLAVETGGVPDGTVLANDDVGLLPGAPSAPPLVDPCARGVAASGALPGTAFGVPLLAASEAPACVAFGASPCALPGAVVDTRATDLMRGDGWGRSHT